MNKGNSLSAKEKRDQKIRRRRRRRSIVWVVVVLAVGSVLIGAFVLYNSSIWRLKKIEVNGGKHITLRKIKKTAAIAPNTDLLKFPGALIRKRLLSIAWVQEVNFDRKLPGTLIINVTERRPFAEITINKIHYLIDKRGFVINRGGKRRLDRSVLLIEGLSISKIRVSKRLTSKPLQTAIKVISNLRGDLRASLKSIAVPSISKLTLFTKDNVEIVYGPAKSMDKKNIIIDKILNPDKKKIIYINVTVVENPVVRKVDNLPLK